MPFVNYKHQYQHQHQFNNKTKFISPPVTPKLYLEPTFKTIGLSEEDCWGSVSTEASSPTSSTSSCYSPVAAYASQIKPKFKARDMSISSRRMKSKPWRSLPPTTKGTFFMPTFVIEKPKLKTPSPRTKKRKHTNKDSETTTENKSLIVTATNDHNTTCKENDALTMPIIPIILPQTLPVAPNKIDSNIHISGLEEEEQLIKKSKTEAASVYDNLSADFEQAEVFLNKEEWIPNLEVFNRRPTVRISWKGSPLKIRNMPYFDKLHAGEVTIAATLRLTPEQYLKCKWALVLAAKDAFETNALFRKSEAQKVCCIDVNKTSVLWNAFGKLGWLGSNWPQ